MSSDFVRLAKDADDDDLREWIEWAGNELKARDATRKDEARGRAQAILSKAADEARVVLQGVGLAFEPGKTKRARRGKPMYRAGQVYCHPDKADLRWNGKGVRPAWVKDLERRGRSPEAITGHAAPSSALAK